MTQLLLLIVALIGGCNIVDYLQAGAAQHDLMNLVTNQEPCSLPCVLGITVEQTTVSEAETAMLETWGTSSVYHPNETGIFACIDTRCSQSIAVSHRESTTIQRLTMMFEPQLFSCSSFVSVYGYPDYFFDSPEVSSYVMLYSDERTEVIVAIGSDQLESNWIETIFVWNDTDFRARLNALKAGHSASLATFHADVYCPTQATE